MTTPPPLGPPVEPGVGADLDELAAQLRTVQELQRTAPARARGSAEAIPPVPTWLVLVGVTALFLFVGVVGAVIAGAAGVRH